MGSLFSGKAMLEKWGLGTAIPENFGINHPTLVLLM
jgi:hypothetical protein